MGHSVCAGYNTITQKTTHFSGIRSCDVCDKCPKCDGFRMIRLYCWRCCGPTRVCPGCALKAAKHIVEAGPPTKGWEQLAEAVRGYERAKKIVEQAERRAKAVLYKAIKGA